MPPADLNRNTEWFLYPGVWTTYILILFFTWLLVLSVFGCSPGMAWTIVNLSHFAVCASILFFSFLFDLGVVSFPWYHHWTLDCCWLVCLFNLILLWFRFRWFCENETRMDTPTVLALWIWFWIHAWFGNYMLIVLACK